ncbi:MAG: site-2 protease family protein [Methanobacteriota archaeon]|nr:MAG: site-2 protease family protein [Euryarchaeota archaeon]
MSSILLHPLFIFVLVISIWIIIMYILYKKKVLEGTPFALSGPFLLWKTERGKEFIDKLSKPKRFWKVYGDFSIVVTFVVMFTFLFLLMWVATLVMNIPESRVPRPEMILGIPGLNPIIPIWYGIMALIIAMVVHEFAHGILTRVAKSRIESLGVVFFILPIGAFVEPNEDELTTMKKRKRSRLFAAGPTTNIIVALICSLIFTQVFIGSAEPKAIGNGIIGVIADTPAANASLEPGMIITSIEYNGTVTDIDNSTAFSLLMSGTRPNETINMTLFYNGQITRKEVILTSRDNKTQGLLGVYTIYTGTGKQIYYPTIRLDSLDSTLYSLLVYVTLPIRGLSPIEKPYTDFYGPTGAMAAIPESAFWVLANTFYWVFWINLMLGLTNALPAVPLDGGYVFRDGLDTFLSRIRKDMKPERREAIVRNVSYFLAFFILALILWQLIGPRVF